MTNQHIILASASTHRGKILQNAGLEFEQVASTLDERALEAPLEQAGTLPEDRAEILAEAKAVDVSKKFLSAWTIGCDQILSFNGEVLHKCNSMEEARRRLISLSGKTHMLHSAIVLAKNGETIWRHVSPCQMTMRLFDPGYVGRHLAQAGEGILSSVGAYQIEGQGANLFEKIEGDLFSIIGLPLFPLLGALREKNVIDG